MWRLGWVSMAVCVSIGLGKIIKDSKTSQAVKDEAQDRLDDIINEGEKVSGHAIVGRNVYEGRSNAKRNHNIQFQVRDWDDQVRLENNNNNKKRR